MADPTNATNPAGTSKAAGSGFLGNRVPKGAVDQDKKSLEAGSVNHGPQRYALGIATVVRVDYETHQMDIRTETGETFQYKTGITYAGVGTRRFFGSVPEVGDACVVGWAAEESGRTRKPYVLTWVPIGTVFGHDWVSAQPFSEDEFSQTPADTVKLKGVADRVRHKLRHLLPGNAMASSSQGADLVLDESVLLANRRGNEIHLRDADQAIVLRSLQQFHAGSGFRIYGGMVQREATLLPTQLFSDGIDWAAAKQIDDEGRSLLINASDNPSEYGAGELTPAGVFQRDADGNTVATDSLGIALGFSANIDPYVFLEQGLFISPDGTLTSPIDHTASYAGKPLYRVGLGGDNAYTNPQAETFTEYRIEVAHTSDGTLPVTEQTDGFDADRIADAVPRELSTLNQSINTPFIEWVMGTVVGNDPFSVAGRRLYGLPLAPSVFDGDARAPALSSAVGVPVESQAATLFKLKPPTDVVSSPTWWSVTKDGRLFFSVPGSGADYSVQGSLGAGARIGMGASPAGESFKFEADGTIRMQATSGNVDTNLGIELASPNGAVRIYGGQSTTEGGVMDRNNPTSEGDGGLWGVLLESGTHMELRASKSIILKANTLDFTNLAEFRMKGVSSAINIESGENFSLSTKVLDQTTMGKANYTFSGPKDSLPTNLPLRSTKFIGNPATGVPGGPVDQYFCLYGDRTEAFAFGNHTTAIAVGNLTYATALGAFTAVASGATLNLSAAGAQVVAPTGAVTLTATAGAVAITASTAVGITAPAIALTAGVVTVPGAHLPPGGVLTDGCINPLTGTPFILSGVVGVQTVRIGA
jgi:hypothetical protein